MPFDDYKKPEKGCAEKREGKLSPDTKKPGRTELKKKSRGRKGRTEGPMESMNENKEGT
jgi:hypothetical protein